MDINTSNEKGMMILEPSGHLDTVSAPIFGKALTKLLVQKPLGCLIDLSAVTYISSSGLQVLLTGAKIAQKETLVFGVFGMNAMVSDVFNISGFGRFIDSFMDRDEALAKVNDTH